MHIWETSPHILWIRNLGNENSHPDLVQVILMSTKVWEPLSSYSGKWLELFRNTHTYPLQIPESYIFVNGKFQAVASSTASSICFYASPLMCILPQYKFLASKLMTQRVQYSYSHILWLPVFLMILERLPLPGLS